MKPHARIRLLKDYGDVLVGEVLDHPNQHTFRARAQQTSPIVARHHDGTIETENTIYTIVRDEIGLDARNAVMGLERWDKRGKN